jgi:glycosyltransferase involved in cell wall biosynthesis
MPALSLVHVLAPARYGGLESVVETLATAQVAIRDSVCVVPVLLPDDADHPLLGRLDASGVDVRPVIAPQRHYRREQSLVAAILKDRQADICHSHGYRPDIVDAPVARRLGIPTVSTVHGFTSGSVRTRLYERLQRRAFRRFNSVIAVSEQLRTDLLLSGVPVGVISVIRNAWATPSDGLSRAQARRELGVPPDVACIGWIGRMSREKGPDVFVRTAALVSHPDVRFCAIGAGPMALECRSLSRELGLGGRFIWPGPLVGASRYLRAFDAVVLTSWTEGTPMVLLEAMGAGIPVVATSVGGVPDVVSVDEAHLCRAGDVSGLGAAIDDVLQDAVAAGRRAAVAGRRLSRDFAVAPWASAYRTEYAALVGEVAL